jgi:hypothetical protein
MLENTPLLVVCDFDKFEVRTNWTNTPTEIYEFSLQGLIAIRAAQKTIANLLNGFVAEIASTKVLDPACGSGNFLYVALKRLLDLEKRLMSSPIHSDYLALSSAATLANYTV